MNEDATRFVRLCRQHGTDKQCYHDYGLMYAEILAPFVSTGRPVRLLEIGIESGASLRLWRDYFNRPVLFGVDWKPECCANAPSGTAAYCGDQSDSDFMARVAKESGGSFDIVIDDGGHMHGQARASFDVLWPHVRTGGIYIIEDLYFASSKWRPDRANKAHRRGGITTLEWLFEEVDSRTYQRNRRRRKGHDATFTFWGEACIIRKLSGESAATGASGWKRVSKKAEKYSVLFQHIPRTAGSSIAALLKSESLEHRRFSLWDVRRRNLSTRVINQELRPAIVYIGHTNLADLTQRDRPRYLSREQIGGCAVIAFVRNPWRRLVSAYELLCQIGQHRTDKAVRPFLESFPSFAEQVCSDQWMTDGVSMQFDSVLRRFGAWMAQPQVRWLDAISMAIDEPRLIIGRFESLIADLGRIFDSVGIKLSGSLPRMGHARRRRNGTMKPPYHTYWTPALRDLAAGYYAEDIERFGYTFDGEE